MSITVYRVQDDEGRGPFKPGFSHRWVDADDELDDPEARFKSRPDVITEFGLDIFKKLPKGMHGGCAFRDVDGLFRWFSQREIFKLKRFNYRLVELDADAVIAESPTQLVVARKLPFREGWRPLIV